MISKNFIPNKQRGEEIVFHSRRHWFIFFRIGLFLFFLLTLPYIIYLFLKTSAVIVDLSIANNPILMVLSLIYYLIMLVLIFTIWTGTYLDVWTVTTEKIISREQNGLFDRVVSELDLYRIQDVTAEQKGFFSTIFHYGNVYIQSAGTKERFVFEQIPNPYKIAKIIQKLDEKAKRHHAYEQKNEN